MRFVTEKGHQIHLARDGEGVDFFVSCDDGKGVGYSIDHDPDMTEKDVIEVEVRADDTVDKGSIRIHVNGREARRVTAVDELKEALESGHNNDEGP